jgi:hypothetical protein
VLARIYTWGGTSAVARRANRPCIDACLAIDAEQTAVGTGVTDAASDVRIDELVRNGALQLKPPQEAVGEPAAGRESPGDARSE